MDLTLKLLLILLHIKWQKVIAAVAQRCLLWHRFSHSEKYASPPHSEIFHMDFAESELTVYVPWWHHNSSHPFKINEYSLNYILGEQSLPLFIKK